MDDASFCHRCGKAQRDLLPDAHSVADAVADPVDNPGNGVTAEPISVPLGASSPAAGAALPISFRNTLAVRIGFLVASIASVLDAMPAVNLLCIIWSVCAGFIAVVLYRRSTGHALSIREGVRMGWITGVLNSLIITILTTIAVASNSTELNAAFREQVRAKASNDAATMAMIENPYVLASGILFFLLLVFIVFTGACIAGGALGARVIRDDRAPGHQPR